MVDNCQHVSMVCCTNLADFCRRVGIADLFRRSATRSGSLSLEGKLSAAGRRALAGPLPPVPGASSGRIHSLSWAVAPPRRLRRGVPDGRADPTARARSFQRVGSAATARPPGRSGSLLGDRPGVSAAPTSGSTGWTSATRGRCSSMVSSGIATAFRWRSPLAPLGEVYGTRPESWLADRGVEVRLTAGVQPRSKMTR